MKVLMVLLYLIPVLVAEPPVDGSYPAARSAQDHHHHEHHHHDGHQRSLSQEYGIPSEFSGYPRNALPTDYGVPNTRSALGSRFQKNARPAARVSFNQRFSSAASSSSQGYPTARNPSQEYGVPNARNGISQGYAAARTPAQEYGVPSIVSARTLSTEYGVPDARSPSEEYGVPVVAARNNQHSLDDASHIRSFPLKSHSGATSGSQESHAHSAFSARSNDISHGFSSSSPFVTSSRSLTTSYGAPSTRSSNSDGLDSVSQTYGAPNARSLSQEYGLPSSRSLKTGAVASAYAPARSVSRTYLPAARMLSDEYGVPEQRDSSQGYSYPNPRALEELLNQEPANYDFAYQIEDQESGSDFGHTETRQENRAEGSYFVVLPDGTKQTVEYEADERGYKPRISVVPADGGYDENAALLQRAEGPY